MNIIGRLDIRFGPVDGPVHMVIPRSQFCEMGVTGAQGMDSVDLVGEFLCQFVGCVGHGPGPFHGFADHGIDGPALLHLDADQGQQDPHDARGLLRGNFGLRV